MHTIANAYDAWWFLYEHPKFKLRERMEIKPEEVELFEPAGYLITKDRGGKCYREWRHLYRHALEENLDIHYAKVDETGTVNEDDTKNVNVECWLEFGPMEYGYSTKWDEETHKMHFHDIDLDCGAPTFDEALVELAKLVLAKEGDYEETEREGECGKPICGDCAQLMQFRKEHKL